MVTKKYITLISFLLVSFMLQGQTPQAFNSRWDSLIKAYTNRLEKVNIIGSSIVFVKEGEMIAKEFYGYQDKDTKEPINLYTIYNWGSCTKPFTAIAVMQLRDKGLLKLEDPISTYIPEVKKFKNTYNKEITIAHLLGHTSGLPRWSRTAKLEDGIFYEADTWEAYQQAFSGTELVFEPGSQFMYSNMGYNLLGRLIQNITHVPFTEYVTTHILEPLDMKSSYFDFTPVHLEKYRSNNYRGHKNKLYSKGKDYTDGLSNPSGGLNAPIPDMVKFMNFMYCLDGGKESYEKVLKRSTLEEMLTPKSLMHGKNKHAHHTHHVGIGFHSLNPEVFPLIGHEGESRGFMSSIWVNLQTKTGYALAWNTSHRLPVKKDNELFRDLNEVAYNSLFPLFRK